MLRPASLPLADLVDHLRAVHDALQDGARDDDPEPARPPADRVRRLDRRRAAVDATSARSARTRPTPRAARTSTTSSATTASATARSCTSRRSRPSTGRAFIGFFPGLPFMFPLDPRETIFVPKYNPTRTWTAEGAVGIGGPVRRDLPRRVGGRLPAVRPELPIYDIRQRNAVFRENPLLIRAGDRVQFHRVEEDELLQAFEDVHADRYRYRIEDAPSTSARSSTGGRRRGRGGGAAASGGRRPPRRRPFHELRPRSSRAGIQATVQDYPGRRGMQAQGFFPAGPMDHLAHRAANLLVGNPESAATLEITLGNFRARLDDGGDDRGLRRRGGGHRRRRRGRRSGRAIGCRRAPSSRSASRPRPGFRFYLGIAGGFDVPLALRLPRDVHDGRARRAGRPAAAAGRPASAGRRRTAKRRGAPARGSCAPAVLARVGGAGDARPAGGAGLPDRGRPGDAVRQALARRPRTRTAPAFGSSRTSSSGHGGAAGSPAAIPRTSSTTATRSARSTSTATSR